MTPKITKSDRQTWCKTKHPIHKTENGLPKTSKSQETPNNTLGSILILGDISILFLFVIFKFF